MSLRAVWWRFFFHAYNENKRDLHLCTDKASSSDGQVCVWRWNTQRNRRYTRQPTRKRANFVHWRKLDVSCESGQCFYGATLISWVNGSLQRYFIERKQEKKVFLTCLEDVEREAFHPLLKKREVRALKLTFPSLINVLHLEIPEKRTWRIVPEYINCHIRKRSRRDRQGRDTSFKQD